MSTANIIGNAIFGLRNKSGGNYIDPAVKESLVGLWKFDQNTNESPTRNIIKNTIKDKGGDLELLNFAYKANSGYNGYPEDFTTYTYNAGNVIVKHDELSFNGNANTPTPIIYKFLNGNDSDLKEYTINFTKIGDAKVTYRYIDINGNLQELELIEGKNKLPYSYVSKLPIDNTTIWIGYKISKGNGCTITQLPLYEGALVTDGKDDMIVSQKTVQEMLGGSNVCTVVSMIHQINLSAGANTSINNIRSESVAHVCARHLNTAYGKTGIFGYSKQLNTTSNPTLINNILGDKKDYIADGADVIDTTDKYFVQGYKYNDSLYELSEVAVYWTFIANKVLTTDKINQIIAYFKLDKYVTPQVIYDVKRQGLTNDTPAADWYLKDFSGNGHDMQLYNYAKKGNSGIGKYETDFTTWSKGHFTDKINIGSSKIEITGTLNTSAILINTKPTSMYNVEINSPNKSITIYFQYNDIDGTGVKRISLVEGINKLPSVNDSLFVTSDPLNSKGITIEQIPDYEGALVSDGIDDYGYADNLPIYKDYTVVADYARLKYGVIDSAIVSKSYIVNNGAFAFNLASRISPKNVSAISFGVGSPQIQNDDNYRKIRYQSKYINDSVNISAGTGIDSDKLWISCLRENKAFSESALYSILLFPYSLSEFLLERQLKRYKLGTLYPDMVEFRPIINVNIGKTYNVFEIRRTDTNELLYYYINGSVPNNMIGTYLPKGTNIRILVKWDNNRADVTQIKFNGKEYELNRNYDNSYYINVTLDKSPQKIDIYADEYIRYEDIVQPYPAIINLKQDGKTITWGDKLKVGSEVTFINHINLLPEIYTISGGVSYNGTIISGWNTPIVVAKSMVFTNVHNWKLNTTEPHAIYSPQKLNIPNSSLKILGYVPDLTGKGNHGKLKNFAYAGMSGANGYSNNFNSYTVVSGVTKTNSSIKVEKELTGSGWFLAIPANTSVASMKLNITGIPSNKTIKWATNVEGIGDIILVNGINEIPAYTSASVSGIYAIFSDLQGLKIEQIGEHEGSICFDGTDDHITIPTLAHGGKCVMMKVNWSNNGMLYDQRLNSSVYTFGILTGEATLAYNARNNGSTYIDGILNANIIPSDLVGITHNITAVNDAAIDNNTVSPRLGVSVSNAVFSNQALYEFMLFPEIPSEDEIKKLNDVMGIEGGYVESPDYYWDAYGKSNSDADRATIIDQVSKEAANALTANNFAFNEESGYVNNGLVSDGVDDNLKNTNMPVLTDYTWIMKRKRLNDKSSTTLCHKGNGSNSNAFLFEFIEGTTKVRSFGADSTVVFPDLISWQTKNSYNGQTIASGTSIDGNALHIFMGSNVYPYYTKAVFYKAMLYSKTIDQLSINMLKNLFERDELIDLSNPIFKK